MSERHENLSVVVMARDAAREIEACLDSVQGAGEVIVADTGSVDATRQVAAARGARVAVLQWEGFGKTRAAAFALAERSWILWLDTDERVTPELWSAIGDVVGGPAERALSGYEVKRRANFLGRWMHGGGWGRDRVTRLFRRDSYRVVERPVHEGVEISGSMGRLEGELLHYTDPSLAHYLEKFNRYTTLAAGEMHRAGKRTRLADLLLRPSGTFARMYIVKAGFVDALPGFILAALSATYVFVKYAKLWELNRGVRDAQTHIRA